MAQFTLEEAQEALIGIITSVEAGVTSPEDAVEELAAVREESVPEFKPNYTLGDFQDIRLSGASYEYELSADMSADTEDREDFDDYIDLIQG